MPRTRNPTETKKLQTTISLPAYQRLEWLAKAGLYGPNPAEVAKYLIINSLDQLTREKVIPLTLTRE